MDTEIHRDTNYFKVIKLGKKSNIFSNKYILSHNNRIILNILHWWFQSMTFHKIDKAGVPRRAGDIIV